MVDLAVHLAAERAKPCFFTMPPAAVNFFPSGRSDTLLEQGDKREDVSFMLRSGWNINRVLRETAEGARKSADAGNGFTDMARRLSGLVDQ